MDMATAKRDRKKRIILKLGTSTLTKGTSHISRGKLEDIARQIHTLKNKYDFILVSSGAIAAAKQFVKLQGDFSIEDKQALAAIGQPHLMRLFYEIFTDFGLPTSQCLLTYRDFDNQISKKNIIHTINCLLDNGYLPIINENDTTATEEIKFGDNDKLAALTAVLLDVDLLVMATNTNGLYSTDPSISSQHETIKEVHDISSVHSMIGESKSTQGSGGMKSKIQAAEIAHTAGIETWLVNGLEEDFISEAMNGNSLFTRVTIQNK